MTVDEKIGQLNLLSGHSAGTPQERLLRLDELKQDVRSGQCGALLNVFGANEAREMQRVAVEESRLKIPLLLGYDVIHGYRTTFPIPLAEAASFHPELVQESARIAAAEASAAGVNWVFAPMVDIARDARWGRIAEGSGEDPYLGSIMAAARVHGFQGSDLTNPETVAACVKHFLGYGFAEGGRDYNTANFGPRTLHEIVLPPFQAAIDAGVASVMSSFNEIDGEPVSGSSLYLTNILREQLHFQGFVVSDWNSVGELVQHGIATNPYEAAVRGLHAGVDMDMTSKGYVENLKLALQKGDIQKSELDEAVRHILRVKFQLGLFDHPYRNASEENENREFLSSDHRAHARTIARESIVLLKNSHGVLPLPKNLKRIALIGPAADDADNALGTWSRPGDPKDVVTLYQAMKSALPQTEIQLVRGCDYKDPDTSGIAEAVNAAKNADAVVLAVGETKEMSGEDSGRSAIELPGAQTQLILGVLSVNKRAVVVVTSGRPNALQDIDSATSALFIAWHLGVESGHAITDVLFGDYNPSGKLPACFPRVTGQVPCYYNHKNTGRPLTQDQQPRPGYVDLAAGPLYPFGFGLSYTTFEYSNLQLNANTMPRGGSISVSVTVQNTGKVKGQDVAQLYMQDPIASTTRPVRILRGFQKLELNPGESKQIQFTIHDEDLMMYDLNMKRVVEPGEFILYVGNSSLARLHESFRHE